MSTCVYVLYLLVLLFQLYEGKGEEEGEHACALTGGEKVLILRFFRSLKLMHQLCALTDNVVCKRGSGYDLFFLTSLTSCCVLIYQFV